MAQGIDLSGIAVPLEVMDRALKSSNSYADKNAREDMRGEFFYRLLASEIPVAEIEMTTQSVRDYTTKPHSHKHALHSSFNQMSHFLLNEIKIEVRSPIIVKRSTAENPAEVHCINS